MMIFMLFIIYTFKMKNGIPFHRMRISIDGWQSLVDGWKRKKPEKGLRLIFEELLFGHIPPDMVCDRKSRRHIIAIVQPFILGIR